MAETDREPESPHIDTSLGEVSASPPGEWVEPIAPRLDSGALLPPYELDAEEWTRIDDPVELPDRTDRFGSNKSKSPRIGLPGGQNVRTLRESLLHPLIRPHLPSGAKI